MNILAIFLLLIFIILFLKIKISIYFKFENFESYTFIKLGKVEFKRKGTLVKRKKKYVVPKKITNFLKNIKLDKKTLVSILKYIEVEKLNINLQLGTPFIFLSVLTVPVLSTFLELIKIAPFKKIKSYSYKIVPDYNEFKIYSEIEVSFKIRIIDVLKIFMSVKRLIFTLS